MTQPFNSALFDLARSAEAMAGITTQHFREPLMPSLANIKTAAEANYASEFYQRLQEMIAEFEANLDNEHEIGAKLVSFGQSVQFHLTGLGYYNPSLISFFGESDQGDPFHLVQHVSQISVLFVKMPRQEGKPPRRIGFLSHETEDGESSDEEPMGNGG